MSPFNTCQKSQSFPWAEHRFLAKCKMAAKSYVDVVIPELFYIYFNLLPHFPCFHMIFNAEFISEIISNF